MTTSHFSAPTVTAKLHGTPWRPGVHYYVAADTWNALLHLGNDVDQEIVDVKLAELIVVKFVVCRDHNIGQAQ